MPDYSELLSRIEQASGPDRELDFWISIRFPIDEPTRHSDDELQADIDLVGIEGMVIDAPYTASLDATVALVERMLPGAVWSAGKGWDGPWSCIDTSGTMCNHEGRAATTVLALLTALFRALSAREAKDGGGQT